MDLMDYRRKIIANSPHLASASGAIATFPDGADLPLKSLLVDIDPVQSGSGDPSPTNIRPISGWNGVKVTRTGKNLWEPTEAYYKNESGAWFNGTDVASVKSALNSLPVGVYTISFKFSVLTTVSGATSWGTLIHNTVSGYFDVRQTAQHNSGETLTFAKTLTITESNQGKFDHVYMYSGGGNHADVYWYDFQLELGSTATPYEPYNGANVSTDLGQTVYGGTLNPLTGVLTVDRRMLTLSSGGSGTYAYNSNNGQLRITGLKAMTNTIANICSHYKSFRGNFANLPDKSFMASSSTIAIKDSDFTSLASWKSYLDAQLSANTPVQVCVILQAEEVDTIQLTPQQIRSLYGQNSIWADTGNVVLEYWAHQ